MLLHLKLFVNTLYSLYFYILKNNVFFSIKIFFCNLFFIKFHFLILKQKNNNPKTHNIVTFITGKNIESKLH